MEIVCIAVPTYNGEKYLETALHSISVQTYRPIVVLISDDGSTDRTLEIAQQFEQRADFPVFWVSHSRLGLVENWNFCIDYIRNMLPEITYLKFLFQDDLLTPNCISQMVAAINQDVTIAMVFCRRFLVGEVPPSLDWLKYIGQYWLKCTPIVPPNSYFNSPNWMEPPDNKIGEPSNVLLRLALFDQIGDFDPSFRQFCDLEMWLRILVHYPVMFLDQELGGFRIHPDQTTWENVQSDRVWAEIYAVWYKLLTDRVYGKLPPSAKQQIWGHVLLELGRECLRIIKHRKGHRFFTVVSWLHKFVYARFIFAP